MREVLLVINSKAGDTSSDGSNCNISFQPPLRLGDECSVELLSANIWYSMPNISVGTVLDYEYTKVQMAEGVLVTTSGIQGSIDFPVGLYGLSSLNVVIARHLGNHAELGRYDISFSGDESTGRVAIHLRLNTHGAGLSEGEFNISKLTVMQTSSLLRSYLGYTVEQDLSIEGVPDFEYIGDRAASLNTLKSILVDCQQCTGSVLNGRSTGVLANIPLNVAPGSQVQYQPRHSAKVSSNQLSNSEVNELRISLHDQDMRPLNMGGETWEVALRITSG